VIDLFIVRLEMDAVKKGGMWSVAMAINAANVGLCLVVALMAIMNAGNLST